MATVFIDGQAGTTGLQITERLAARSDLSLVYLSDAERKDPARRQASLQQADIAILCLPDTAAREAVALADGQTRILDASTAYRTDPAWAYGLPEMTRGQRQRIRDAQYVSNPGCYPQGFILMIRPLIEAGWLDPDTALRCNAVSGYSGGGRQMIEARQGLDATQAEARNTELYALELSHKHVPEMQLYSGSHKRPMFSPMVGHYYKGMLVQIPLFTDELSGHDPREVHALLAETYAGERFIEVLPFGSRDMAPDGFMNPTACNGTNALQLMVLGNADQQLLVARLDNLGKGASGAAVQNLNLMLGTSEETGL